MEAKLVHYGDGPNSFGAFVEHHKLAIIVAERSSRYGLERYFARFDHVEIKDGVMLRSASGDGATPQAAIDALAATISGHRLVFDASGDSRREFTAPNEWTDTLVPIAG